MTEKNNETSKRTFKSQLTVIYWGQAHIQMKICVIDINLCYKHLNVVKSGGFEKLRNGKINILLR